MGTTDDIRKLLQDLVTPDLKVIDARLRSIDENSKLRDDALAASFALKVELFLARMDAQHSTVMNALAIDKHFENLERQVKSAETVAA